MSCCSILIIIMPINLYALIRINTTVFKTKINSQSKRRGHKNTVHRHLKVINETVYQNIYIDTQTKDKQQ